MRDFIEEVLENPFKLWGSVLIAGFLVFNLFSINSSSTISYAASDDPFAQEESSFVSEDELAEYDDEGFEDEDNSFVSQEEIQQDAFEDDTFMDQAQFAQKPFTYKKSVFDKKTGTIIEKEFDMQGHEIKPIKTDDKDKKIEELEQRVNQLEQKLDKDPFMN